MDRQDSTERHWFILWLIDLVTDGYAVTYRRDDPDHIACTAATLENERHHDRPAA